MKKKKKKYILVHDCGHIVQPGDTIAFVDNARNRSTYPPVIGKKGKFVTLSPGRFASGGTYVEVEGYKGFFYAERFNCTIVEIDDDCEN